MFGSRRIKIPKELWQKIERLAALAGYASPEELVLHALEKELAKVDEAQSDAEIQKKLRGLGYIR
jgi:hypothetical protein